MTGNIMTQHRQEAEARWSLKTLTTGEDPRKYRMALLAKGVPRSCPVEGCLGRVATRTAMRVHFLYRHVLKTVVILEEGNLPYPRCTRCDLLFHWWALNNRHPGTDQCARGGEQNRRRLVEDEMKEISERSFEAYWVPLENVMSFRYL